MKASFENWDGVDSKVLTKLRDITNFSENLAEEQSTLKEKNFVFLKDKVKVQKSLDHAKRALQHVVDAEKSKLIDYFDRQLENNSQKAANWESLGASKFFTNSRSRNMSGTRENSRCHSANDLSRYIKRNDECRVSQQDSSRTKKESMTSISRASHRSESEIISDHGMVRSFIEEDLEHERKVVPKPLTDSIFTISLQNHETGLSSTPGTSMKDSKFRGRFTFDERELERLRRYKRFHTQRLNDGRFKAARAFTKYFFKTKKQHFISPPSSVRVQVKDNDSQKEVQELRKALEIEKEKNEKLTSGLKKISHLVISNEEMLADMRKNKKVLETELVKAKEKQTLLLSNFSTFKEYIEKVLVDFTGKLAAFNNKEQIYEEIAQENDELRVKCRDLVEKIKILSQNLPKQ